jgi:hypothetical protein
MGSPGDRDERAAARRREALAQADAKRDDSDARRAVLDAYLAHRDHLEPDTAEGSRRVWFVLEHVPRSTEGLENLFVTAAATSPEADTADRALVAAAALAVRRHDFATTYRRLREALVRRRGSDTAIERAACINLAAALRMEHRHAEALLVARRAATMAVSDDEARGRAAATSILANTLIDLGEPAIAARVTADLAGMVPENPGDAGSVAVRLTVAWLRAEVAHHSGRFDEAIWRLDAMHARENPRSPARRAGYARYRARVLLDAGRASEAALAVRQARDAHDAGDRQDVPLAILEARVGAALDDLDAARERAEHALAVAERLSDEPGPHRARLSDLVSLFRRLGDPERERRCLELVATERLEQLVRADRSARNLPELTGEIGAEDRAILRRVRERALVESRDTLAAFARLLAPEIRNGGAAGLVLAPGDDDLIRVCAWCARVAGRDGRWLPLGHLIPASGPLRATHGMCPDCLADSPAVVPVS